MPANFRDMPSVHSILSDQRIKQLSNGNLHHVVLELVREELSVARDSLTLNDNKPDIDDLIHVVEKKMVALQTPWPKPVVNATGVILHTNLGRAPLSKTAREATERVSQGYSDVELDLESGKRGSRQARITQLISKVTGAQSAFVVNNNASALMLGLSTLAAGKEVIVSRAESIEIGGGFRIPDILRQSGATLIEIGTTNRTYLEDYSSAITDNTGALLAVHPSNFRITGFTHTPNITELAELGKKCQIPVLHDVGSGCLLETAEFGLSHEPTPQESIHAGVSAVFFSGDKLLGGPQSGIIAGQKTVIDQMAKHPLSRAIRIDKLSLAALDATLRHYIENEATKQIPVWNMIAKSKHVLASKSKKWSELLGPGNRVTTGISTIGGGSLPGETLPTSLIRLTNPPGVSAASLALRLRVAEPSILCRIENNQVLIDPRTVMAEQEKDLISIVSEEISVPH